MHVDITQADFDVHDTRKSTGVALSHQQIDFICKRKDYALARIRSRESHIQLATGIDCG